MRRQLLRDGILIDGAEIDVLVSVDNAQLDTSGILAGQQSHVALEELEQVARTVQQKRDLRFLHVIDRQRHTSVGQPQETALDPVEFRVFVQPLQNEAFVFGIQLGRNQVENLLDIEFVVRVVPGDVPFVQADDVLLYGHDLLKIIALDVFAHGGRHTAHDEIEPEQLHDLAMNELIDGLAALPRFAQRPNHGIADAYA